MIDVESRVITDLTKALRAAIPKINIVSENSNTPARFPCVSIDELDNSTYTESLTQALVENHAVVFYQLDYYSNLKTGRKLQCRKMASVADDVMIKLGFIRDMLQPIENLDDPSIYRMTARYTAVVDQNYNFCRR